MVDNTDPIQKFCILLQAHITYGLAQSLMCMSMADDTPLKLIPKDTVVLEINVCY